MSWNFLASIVVGFAIAATHDAIQAYENESCRAHGGNVLKHTFLDDECIEPTRLLFTPAPVATYPVRTLHVVDAPDGGRVIGGTDGQGNFYIGSDDDVYTLTTYPTRQYVGGVPVGEPIKGDAR